MSKSVEEMLAELGLPLAPPVEEREEFRPCQLTVGQLKDLISNCPTLSSDDTVRQKAVELLSGARGLAEDVTLVLNREDVELLGGRVHTYKNCQCLEHGKKIGRGKSSDLKT